MAPTEILTSATQVFVNAFGGYLNQFLIWGQWLFGALLVINMGWLWLWYAIDKDGILQGMSAFLKKFFVIMLFYTIMVNHQWLLGILKNTQSMGQILTGIPIYPSSVLSNGVMLGNKILIPIEKSSLLTAGFGLLVGFVVYLAIAYVFINIALELALTLIMSTALISVSTFFLGFAALGATSQIARQSLDVLLANCMKLLGIYLVVGAGSKTINTIASAIPTQVLSFDAYIWIIASVALFYLLAKNLPNQLAKIVSGTIQENHGVDAAALVMAVSQASRIAGTASKAASVAVKSTGVGLATSMAFNAAAHFSQAGTTSMAAKTATAAAGAAKDFTKAGLGMVSDHFKHLANKMAGGPGMARSHSDIPGVSQRLYDSAQEIKTGGVGDSVGSGKPAAAPSSTNAQKPPASTKRGSA